jgi:8-oxo-dGTP pyrophosphatase MutT (NUDIX family)
MNFPERLAFELKNLPGEVAHKSFYPYRFKNYTKPIDARLSAVAVHFFRIETEVYFLLIERSEYDGHHSKQIAFPGGKKELYDKNLEDTARRESIEEINIDMNYSKLIGQITPVYIPISNFDVHPFLFWHNKLPSYDLSSHEVNDVLLVKCSDLIDEKKISDVDIQLSESTLKNIPCFKFEDIVVWGATALILNEIKQLLKRL